MCDDDPELIELVNLACRGDRLAWNKLVRRYASLVHAICKRDFRLSDSDCDDVGQTVWLKLVEALPRLRQPAALPGWLVTTTRRECARLVKQGRQQGALELQPEFDYMGDDQPTEQRLLAEGMDAALREAFSQLGPRCQQLLVLLLQRPRVPYTEISARMGMPVGGIGPNRARCLDKLRRCPALAAWFDDDYEDEEGG